MHEAVLRKVWMFYNTLIADLAYYKLRVSNSTSDKDKREWDIMRREKDIQINEFRMVFHDELMFFESQTIEDV